MYIFKEKRLLIEFEKVSTDENIECVVALAREIWTHHYANIIGKEQVEYMLVTFQNSSVIKSQIVDGAEYYLAKMENNVIGYIGLGPNKDKDKILLSKLYVKSAARGKGAGKGILDFVESKCVAEDATLVWLTVNKMNDGAIKWYKRRGFEIIEKVKIDVGCGYFMDDYIMEKRIRVNAKSVD